MPFICPTCGKVFTAKRSLRRHEDSTHRNVRFYCKICSGEFARSDSLSLHMKSKHCHKILIKTVERKKKKKKDKAPATSCAVRVKRIKKQTDCEYNSDIIPSDTKPADGYEKTFEKHNGHNKILPNLDIPPPEPANNSADPIDAVLQMLQQEVDIKAETGVDNDECCSGPLHAPAPDPGPPNPAPLPNTNPPVMTILPAPSVSNAQSTAPEIPAATYHSASSSNKQASKRCFVDQEIDFTVLDILQQSAMDGKDEDRMFLLSILSDFKRVPLEKKLKVKAKIVGAIVEALD